MEDEEEEEREGDSPSKVMIADIPEKKGVVIVEVRTIDVKSGFYVFYYFYKKNSFLKAF